MKLLNTFKDQLLGFDTVERVWLTSFTIDIEFIETYVLAAIAGIEIPRLRMDYEALQLTLNELGIDVRVFCDKRYIGENLNKRTLLPIHGVSPGKNGGINPEFGITEESLFHSKVIYIEGLKDGERIRVLGAGSANLTLSGWGRNREVFHFLPLDERLIYYSTKDFFDKLFKNVEEYCPLKSLKKFSRKTPRARFCHSFQSKSFLEQFFERRSANEILIWSPYFSKDLSRFARSIIEHLDLDDLTLHLVPHRVDNQYLRSGWNGEVATLLSSGKIKLYKLPQEVRQDDRVLETHAKLWRAGQSLAIGSWNATLRGANIHCNVEGTRSPGNNIEAGLIVKDKVPFLNYLGTQLTQDMESLFADEEQLLQEALQVPEAPPFDLQVRFSWANLSYDISGVWNGCEQSEKPYFICLPDVDSPVELKWKRNCLEPIKIPCTVAPTKLLTDHCYQIHCIGQLCYTGLIYEIDQPYRRGQRYATLESMFDAFVQPGPGPAEDDLSYRITESESGELVVDGWGQDQTLSTLPESSLSGTSYFRLFLASYQFAVRLRQIAFLPDKRRPMMELEHWVFTRPGSLEEWVQKAKERIEKGPPGIFEWFLANEVRELCELSLKMRTKLGAKTSNVPLSRWKELSLNKPRLPEGVSSKYVEYLESEYKSIRREWGVG